MRKTIIYALSALFLSCSAHPKVLNEPSRPAANIIAKWHSGVCEVSKGYLKITGNYKNNGMTFGETKIIALNRQVSDDPISLFCSEDLIIIASGNFLFVSRGTIKELLDPALT